jgi:hypothetical protein
MTEVAVSAASSTALDDYFVGLGEDAGIEPVWATKDVERYAITEMPWERLPAWGEPRGSRPGILAAAGVTALLMPMLLPPRR